MIRTQDNMRTCKNERLASFLGLAKIKKNCEHCITNKHEQPNWCHFSHSQRSDNGAHTAEYKQLIDAIPQIRNDPEILRNDAHCRIWQHKQTLVAITSDSQESENATRTCRSLQTHQTVAFFIIAAIRNGFA